MKFYRAIVLNNAQGSAGIQNDEEGPGKSGSTWSKNT